MTHSFFFKVVSFLKENDNKKLTVGDLCQKKKKKKKMRNYFGGGELYSKEEHMERKLMKTLDGENAITNFHGKDSVVDPTDC